MTDNFFENYQAFVVVPTEETDVTKEPFNPANYSKHFILTLSLYDPLISCWREARDLNIDIEKSLDRVVEEFNSKKKGSYRLHVLELEENKPYFVMALSCKTNIEQEAIPSLLERDFFISLFVAESWYQLIGYRGKFERRLFTFTSKEYAGH